MKEYDVIRTIAAKFPRSKSQLNALFECDAELIRIGDQVWGLTLDDFSPEEDLFTSDHPETLGANLAVATLSDLLAAGVEPRFFLHALSIPRNVPRSFLDGMTDGIRTVLEKANCALCGGDFGTTDAWRYCGFAMGPVISTQPLTHKRSGKPRTLWVTGQLGDANGAALKKTSTPAFELRLREAEAIRRYATGCIDTSGGLMDAIWILHEWNPGMRIEIHAEKIPLATGIREFAKQAGLPAEAALVGGAGEYELLFATSEDLAESSRKELEKMGMTAIADLSMNTAPGVLIYRAGNLAGTMTGPPPCPRAAETMSEHVKAVAGFAAALFGGEKPK
jgi:thiamine-monophosphate kinase